MHILRTAPALRAFLQTSADAKLAALIAHRVAELAEHADEISDLVAFVVVLPGDSAEHLDAALGGLLSRRFEPLPFGAPGFTPWWDGLALHAGWFELTYVLSDSGFGLVVYVSEAVAQPLELQAP